MSTSVTSRLGELYYNPAEIKTVFDASVDLMLAQGTLFGKPSSIVNLNEDEPEILREGAGDISYFL